MGMVKHCQSSENSKFAISLQYLKKQVRNGVHFLHADKHHIYAMQNIQILHGGPVMFVITCFTVILIMVLMGGVNFLGGK